METLTTTKALIALLGVMTLIISWVILKRASKIEKRNKRLMSELFVSTKSMNKVELRAKAILTRITGITGVTEEQMRGPSRQSVVTAARAVYFHFCKEDGVGHGVASQIINKDRTSAAHYENDYKKNDYYHAFCKRYNECFVAKEKETPAQ